MHCRTPIEFVSSPNSTMTMLAIEAKDVNLSLACTISMNDTMDLIWIHPRCTNKEVCTMVLGNYSAASGGVDFVISNKELNQISTMGAVRFGDWNGSRRVDRISVIGVYEKSYANTIILETGSGEIKFEHESSWFRNNLTVKGKILNISTVASSQSDMHFTTICSSGSIFVLCDTGSLAAPNHIIHITGGDLTIATDSKITIDFGALYITEICSSDRGITLGNDHVQSGMTISSAELAAVVGMRVYIKSQLGHIIITPFNSSVLYLEFKSKVVEFSEAYTKTYVECLTVDSQTIIVGHNVTVETNMVFKFEQTLTVLPTVEL